MPSLIPKRQAYVHQCEGASTRCNSAGLLCLQVLQLQTKMINKKVVDLTDTITCQVQSS